MIYVISILISLLLIIGVVVFINNKNVNNDINLNIERINESIKNINLFLDKKDELYSSSIPIIKNSNKRKYAKKEILGDLIKNKNKKLSMHERYEELNKIEEEFNKIIDDDEKLNGLKELKKIRYKMKNNENDLSATVKFYNESIDNIEKIKKNVFSNIIYKSKNYKEYDKIKIIDEEEFEILKEG